MEPQTIKINEVEYVRKDAMPVTVLSAIARIEDFVGKSFFFRTVTYHLTGRVTAILETAPGTILLALEDAAWIADSGRFMQTIRDGSLNEIEPVGDAILNLSTVTDMFPWTHPLPVTQK